MSFHKTVRRPHATAGLSAFMRDANFSTEREVMMEHWLIHEVYKAFCSSGQPPLVYRTEYDRGGFDIAVGHFQFYREFQLKVKAKSAKTPKWEIDRLLMLPPLDGDLHEQIGFLNHGLTAGRGGGVILMEVDVNACNELTVDLHYCDAFTLVFQAMNDPDRDASWHRVLSRLQSEHKTTERSQKLSIKKSCFLKVKSVCDLLKITGFRALDSENRSLREYVRSCYRRHRIPGMLDEMNAWMKPMLKS